VRGAGHPGVLGQDVGVATLDELEESEWPEPGDGVTFLVRRCHELRRKDLADLTVEDLRILIGQGIGLQWLVPIAVELVEADPTASGDLYEGDLFSSLINVPDSFWATDGGSWLRVRAVAKVLTVTGERAAAWLARTRSGA
jgi:hypothetical protein